MNRYLLFMLYCFISISVSAQIIRKGDLFTKVYLVNDKVVFIKEIPSNKGISKEANFKILRDWAKENYGRDPFISSIRYDAKNTEFIAKSKIELLLPQNSQGIREKMIMRYRINGFLSGDKCILEITDISYLYENAKRSNIDLPHVIKAENFITDKDISIRDNLTEIKNNTRKSTLYFVNELALKFENIYKSKIER